MGTLLVETLKGERLLVVSRMEHQVLARMGFASFEEQVAQTQILRPANTCNQRERCLPQLEAMRMDAGIDDDGAADC